MAMQKRKRRIVTAAVAAAAVICLALAAVQTGLFAPALTIGTARAETGGEVVLDVTLSALPEELYPAASVSIRFDKDKLALKEVRQGTMLVYDNFIPDGNTPPPLQSAEWLCDPRACNDTGVINAMYLDMTGEKNAYGKDGFERNAKDVLIRLCFQVKEGAQAGEILPLEFTDAVLAAQDGDRNGTSLSGGSTLRLVNGSIEVV